MCSEEGGLRAGKWASVTAAGLNYRLAESCVAAACRRGCGNGSPREPHCGATGALFTADRTGKVNKQRSEYRRACNDPAAVAETRHAVNFTATAIRYSAKVLFSIGILYRLYLGAWGVLCYAFEYPRYIVLVGVQFLFSSFILTFSLTRCPVLCGSRTQRSIPLSAKRKASGFFFFLTLYFRLYTKHPVMLYVQHGPLLNGTI